MHCCIFIVLLVVGLLVLVVVSQFTDNHPTGDNGETSTQVVPIVSTVPTGNGCECVHYECDCCQHVEPLINATMCLKASYLPVDIGVSVILMYNDYVIINETVSVRNPPPICTTQEIIEFIGIDICLRLYDIQTDSSKFHACFEIKGYFYHMKLFRIPLGCVNIKKNPRNDIKNIN